MSDRSSESKTHKSIGASLWLSSPGYFHSHSCPQWAPTISYSSGFSTQVLVSTEVQLACFHFDMLWFSLPVPLILVHWFLPCDVILLMDLRNVDIFICSACYLLGVMTSNLLMYLSDILGKNIGNRNLHSILYKMDRAIIIMSILCRLRRFWEGLNN